VVVLAYGEGGGKELMVAIQVFRTEDCIVMPTKTMKASRSSLFLI
jgi:hypothetical protein